MPKASDSEVKLQHIQKTFGGFKASNDVNLTIEKGRIIGLLGPSGSGKTTILRMIAGLETPDSGDIYIVGQRVNDIEPGKRGIGFVFQNYALFRYMTVRENIAFGLTIQKTPRKKIKERVDALTELVGLKDFGHRYPMQLSGGQRQRVAFARPSRPSRSCCCSTSRSRPSTRKSARNCAAGCARPSTSSASRASSSRTTRTKPSRSRMTSSS